MEEVWEDIVGYEGKYQVSNMGRVKSLNYKRTGEKEILKSRVNRHGYLYVGLCKDSKVKYCTVHKLVALAFVDGYEKGLVVNHIDEDKTNNCAWNLEWVTTAYNNTYNNRHKKIANKNKGRKRSEESKKKMSENHADVSGKNNPNYGNGKKVMCLETGEVFTTVKEACKFIGVSCGAIYKAIKEGRSCKGLHWKYVS